MLTFNINQPPPIHRELKAEKQRLTIRKKQLIKYSIISDGAHGTALLCLYLTDLLNGLGLLAVVGLGTVIAVVLATTLKKQLRTADLLTVASVAVATAFAVGGMVHGLPDATVAGSLLAGLLTGSIVFTSSLIGRQMLQVFTAIEQLKSLAESEIAEQEMLQLCRENPDLEEYRQQARQILRPNLTFGELQAMRDWLKQ
ncbi:MAG: hypothetical protein GXP51_05870 [Deltaproteobacteria bacterium]|nr:hypothetical protein [Deltaproteobacteria bacterium]